MAARPPLAILSLFFTAGAILLMFFVVLGGTRDRTPLDDIYFLRANTGIAGAPETSRWTLWNVCGTENGRNSCDSVRPAYPFDPPRNFGTNENVPSQFIGTKKYYLMSRFMFAFLLIALFFAVCSFFTGLLALFSRLGGAMSGALAATALLFHSAAAALMTATYVRGRRYFRANNRDAHLGPKAFAFTWTSVFCLLLATVLFCMILATGRRDTTRTTTTRRTGYFGRRRAARDRGSFIESESQRRVKDEYS